MIKSHNFAGVLFKVRDQRALPWRDFGECDYEKKRVCIPLAGDTRDELDCILHEALHACCPWMHEDNVNETAISTARLLWRLGWRKEDAG